MSGLHGFIDDMPEDTYHAHPGSLSVSGAKTLLKSPRLFRHQQRNPIHKDDFDFGSAAHKLILGKGSDIVEVEATSWATNAAKAQRVEIREQDKVPMLTKDLKAARDIAEAFLASKTARSLFTGGTAEVSAFCLDDDTGILRRSRFDYLRADILIDLKTARSADAWSFGKAASDYGYHQQAAWYLDIAADLGHPAEGFVFAVVEKTAPYLTAFYELVPEAIQRGRELNERALQMFRDCTAADLWPGYPDEIQALDIPNYAYYDKEPA
jgi:hypothetical protein